MLENLVIVESPAKAKTIERFLGKGYVVKSSFGHIRDLSKKDLGIDIKNNFEPHYEVPADKRAVVKELKALAGEAAMVWLASDEDREGEAIAWHLYEVLGLKPENTKRIVFHEITENAIREAINNPRDIDFDLVNAQQARRVLDRLVGFEVSPVLWRKVKSSLSAGRVQSVAVRLIVDREREINAFKRERYFKVGAEFKDRAGGLVFKADAEKRFDTEDAAICFLEECKNGVFSVESLETKPLVRKPAPPFTTSTLQQEAARKLGFSVSQTMSIAQRLYEQGYITYMRTDSVNLSKFALTAAKKVICDNLGEKYSQMRRFSTKSKGAQEAHEAIRPTYMENDTIPGDNNEKKLYNLIYVRTLASQMADAVVDKTEMIINVSGSDVNFAASGETVVFDGFLRMYKESADDETAENGNVVPALNKGDKLDYVLIAAAENFTLHPPRYTEASLVKKMEALGIGRPSTYAPTISTIQNRGYVIKDSREGEKTDVRIIELKEGKIKKKSLKKNIGSEKKKLFPSDIGIVVTDFLSKHFTNIMDYNFTAKAEEALDCVAEGEREWREIMEMFYRPFHDNVEKTLEIAERNTGARNLGVEPETGEPVSVRIGRFGPIAQIGEGENVRYAGLRKDQLLETITLEDALELFKFPRNLGEFEGESVTVAIGRFGPYIRHNGVFVSLRKDDESPYEIGFDTAVACILRKREEDDKKLIREFDNGMRILNGRFGPYISYEKKNYKIPKDCDMATLGPEDCKEVMESAVQKKKSGKKTSGNGSGKSKTAGSKSSKTSGKTSKPESKTKPDRLQKI